MAAILAIDAGRQASYTRTEIEDFLEKLLPGSQWSVNEQVDALFEYCIGYTPHWARTSLYKEYWRVHEMVMEKFVEVKPDDERLDHLEWGRFQPPAGYQDDDTQWSLSYGSLHFDSAFSALPPTEFPTIFDATF